MHTRTAPAKINLFLHITGRRANGYHEIESLFVFTEQGDRLTVEPSSSGQDSFAIKGPFADKLIAMGGGNEENLAFKALQSMRPYALHQPAVCLTLFKALPVAAGIGGGSADAAATLLLLNDYWQTGLDSETLHSMALDLGADVPACLSQSPQWVSGIGERLEPVIIKYQPYILLVNPLVSTETPLVFQAYKESSVSFDDVYTSKDGVLNSLADLSISTENALEEAACAITGEIRHVLKALKSLKGASLVRMSGSGATCFALFDDERALIKAQKRLQSSHPQWWTQADKIITGDIL
ncbi:4-(cytidine 5'-diphospho)-2-C-methyl-D-erythritol kinase [Temperatibacter marinus]|uniref:4-diphosphocytidyl-2-C-methyl-D-erythritol kinase n=1 Tax=Temperatibacter marinus TaxID=1456591 RepID=A0AA52EE52_9PROT|nr:4-(cytidine 5'-diphospho)-2-C-methyl-D-erythritol kinase [Temperatibacter marinus]WND02008.1 4-(cytidine 5'-diphospho)-2-C-methyl-D-erythritol kinase [Temperatibacter marinus]